MVLLGWLCMSCESMNHEENNCTFMNEQIEESYTGETGTNYYLYFNLGWNGSSNGYYLVTTTSAYTSGSFLYTSDMMTITNIKPN